jgi:RNA polymerase primary sigma factor
MDTAAAGSTIMSRTKKVSTLEHKIGDPEFGGRTRPLGEPASYLSHLTRQRLLSADEEISLAHQVKAGDVRAKAHLVEANMRLVINIAKSYHSMLIPFEDLVQEGAIGLMTACDKYDPSKGYRFSTYATHWVRQAISRAIDNKSRAIRVPAHVSETLRKIDKERAAAMREGLEEPTMEQLAVRVGLSVKKVSEYVKAGQDPVSLDMLVGEEENTSLASLLNDKNAADPQREVIRREVEQELQHILNILTDRERIVMRRRLGFDDEEAHVLQDIGMELNLSRERVRQIEAQALKKMRRHSPRLREYLSDH